MNFQVGFITRPAATGNQTYSLPSNFDPKLLMLLFVRHTADGQAAPAAPAGASLSFGMGTYRSATVNQWAAHSFLLDAGAAEQGVNGFVSTSMIRGVNANGTTAEFDIRLVSMQTGATSNFVLNWATLPGTAGVKIVYLVWGGSDIDAMTGNYTMAAAETTRTVSLPAGFGQPDTVMLGGAHWTASATFNANDAHLNFGVAKDDTECAAASFASDDAAAIMSLATWLKASLQLYMGATPIVDGEVDLQARGSWGTDDFRLTYPDSPSFAFTQGWAVLKGCTVKVGTTIAPTSTGNQTLTGAASSTAKGVVVFSALSKQAGIPGALNTSTVAADDVGGFGIWGSDGTNEGGCAIVEDNGNANAVPGVSHSETKCPRFVTADAAGGVPTVRAEADASLSGADAVLNWTTVNATSPHEFGYWIFGEVSGAAPTSFPLQSRAHPARNVLLRR